MTTPDVPAGRDELRDAIASALYNEFRVGKMPDYRPMWHEVEEATRAKYRAMTNALLEPFAALLARQEAPADFASSLMQGRETFVTRCDVCSNKHSPHCSGCNCARTAGCSDPPGAAPQEAPTEGIPLSAQLSQAAAWMRVWDECQRLGMDTYGAPSTSTGLDIVLDFIRGRAAPQEAREPDGWAVRMRDGSWRSTVYEDRETAERKAVKAREFFAARGDEDDEFDSIDVLPVYLGAPAPAEATEASDALRSAIEAMGDLHRALLHMGRGRLREAEATERSES